MKAILDGALVNDRASLHDQLQEQLNLPYYYGRNLDALFDLLTERSGDTELTVKNWQLLETALGMYAAALMDTLYDAAKENKQLTIQVEQ